MGASLSAPQTAFEWQLFAALLCGFYLVFTAALTGDVLYAIAIGLLGGLGTTVGILLLVVTWRGLRPTTEDRS